MSVLEEAAAEDAEAVVALLALEAGVEVAVASLCGHSRLNP